MARRTLRKLTSWNDEEWATVETQARLVGIPPLRFVREVAVGRRACGSGDRVGSALAASRSPVDAAVVRLTRVLDGLRELRRVAANASAERLAAQIESAALAAETAIRSIDSRSSRRMEWNLVVVGEAVIALAFHAAHVKRAPPLALMADLVVWLTEVLENGGTVPSVIGDGG